MSRKILLFFFISLTSVFTKVLSEGNNQITINNNISSIELLLNISKYSKDKPKLEKISKMRKLLSDLESNESNEPNQFNSAPEYILEIFDIFAGFIDQFNLIDLLDTEEIETCFFDGILENMLNNDLRRIYIDGSGKQANDFGNEFVCNYNVRRNVSYFTVHYYLGTNDFKKDKEEFFGQEYFYIGLCLPKKCTEAAKLLIQNEKIIEIFHNVGISNLKLNLNKDIVERSSKISKFYTIIISVYIGLNIIKLIIGILRIIFMNKGYEGYYAEKERKIKEKNNDENAISRQTTSKSLGLNHSLTSNDSFLQRLDEDAEASFTYDKYISENIISEGEILYNPLSDKEKNFPILLKIMKMFDLFDNLKILSSNSNKYYNSNRIKNLYFIRFLLMIMTIIYQIMNTQINLPTKNFYNFEFYSNFSFIFIKLSVNAPTFWITLDAAIFGYKLMSYLKKEIKLSSGNCNVKYLSFLKILLLILPKFNLFLFAFILLHLSASKFTLELCKGNQVFSNYLYYNDTVQQATYSLRNTWVFQDFFNNFVPFKLNYIDFIEDIKIEKSNKTGTDYTSDVSGYEIPSPFLTNTDLFVNVCFNEFYLIILMINITYLSYKLKSKFFDFSILIINLILYILPVFWNLNPYRGNIEEQNYTLKYVLGQNYTEKFTHYFINFFYFGFLIGVMKFYHEENIYNMKNKKNHFINIILPFQFCKKIITCFNTFRPYLKRIILLSSILVLLVISSSFYFLEGKNFSYEKDIIEFVKISGFVKFLFFYEKNLSGIFFFIFLIIYIVYPENSYLMQLSNSSTFIIIERISFSFYNCFAYIIYAQFCIFIISIQMSYSNLFFNTVGLFFIIFIFSILNAAIFELPIRQLIKYYMNRNLETNFIDNFYKNYSHSSPSRPSDINSCYDNSFKEE